MKSIFIYEGFIDEKIDDFLKSQSHQTIVFNASQDIFLNKKLTENCLIKDVGDYLSREERKEIVSEARDKGKNWFLFLNKELRYKDELSLLDVMTYDNIIFLIEIFKNLRVLEKIFSEDSTSSFIIYRSNSLFNYCCEEFSKCYQAKLIVLDTKKINNKFSFRKLKKILTFRKFLLIKLSNVLGVLLNFRFKKNNFASKQNIVITNYFRFSPLINLLQNETNLKVFVLNAGKGDFLRSLKRRTNIYYPFLMGYIGWVKYMYLLFTARLRNEMKRRVSDKLRVKKLVYRSVNISPLWIWNFLNYFDECAFNYLCFYEAAKTLLVKEKIDTVILNQDSQGYSKILVLLGNSLNKRTICFQHGAYSDIKDPHYNSYVAKEVFVWGEREKELYIKNNLASMDRIRLAGDPFLENLRKRNFDKSDICKQLGISDAKKTVLFVCEKFVNIFLPYVRPTTANTHLELITSLIGSLSDIQLIVRLKSDHDYAAFHDNIELKKEIIRKNNKGDIIINSYSNIYDLLYICDVVIVTQSTVGLEAMLFNKPVIVLNLEEGYDSIGYSKVSAALGVFRKEDFIPTLNSALYDKSIKDKLSEYQKVFLKRNFVNLDEEPALGRIRDLLLGSNG